MSVQVPKTVLITGGAKRIGAACSRLLHAAGFNLVIHFHCSDQQAQALADDLNRQRPGSVVLIGADLQVLSEVKRLAVEAEAVWGGIDVLINNASQFFPTAVAEVSDADWAILFDTNLKAPFFLAQALLPSLSSRAGCIVNIVDIYAQKPLLGYSVYSMAKAGLQAMTLALAKELAPSVRVNAVSPGAILWPETTVSEQQKTEILQKVALQRCGEADDIAKAVRFFITEAPYITGQVLAVDGGRSLFI